VHLPSLKASPTTINKPITMKLNKLLTPILLILTGAAFLALFQNSENIERLIQDREYVQIQRQFNDKVSTVQTFVNHFTKIAIKANSDSAFSQLTTNAQLVSQKGIDVYLYHNGTPIFWSSNLPGPDEFQTGLSHIGILENLSGGTYYVVTSDTLDWCMVAAIKVYTSYPIHNRFLKAELYPASKVFSDIGFNPQSTFNIYSKGTFIYSLIADHHLLKTLLPTLLMIGLLLLAFGITLLLSGHRWNRLEWIKVVITTLVAIMLILVFNHFYAANKSFFPNWLYEGDGNHIDLLLQWLLFILITIPIFASSISAKRLAKLPRVIKRVALPALLAAGATLLSGVAIILAEAIIDVLGPIGGARAIPAGPAITGLISLIILGSCILILLKTGLRIAVFSKTSVGWLMAIMLINTLLVGLLPFESSYDRIIAMVGALSVNILFAASVYIPAIRKIFPLTLAILISVVLSLQFLHTNEENTEEYLAHLAKGLAMDHDPVAENIIIRFSDKMKADSSIATMMKKLPKSLPQLHQYLSNNYFKGYLTQYDMQVTACPHGTKLFLNDINKHVGCKNFFMDMALDIGKPILKDHVYYLNNNNGRISYLLMYSYPDGTSGNNFLSVEIDSKLAIDLPGYPSLLIDNGQQNRREEIPSDISFAKYHGEKLETKSGTFSYTLKMPAQLADTGIVVINHVMHFVFKSSDDQRIVVSRQTYSIIFLLSPFVYIFLATYIMVMLVFRRRKALGKRHTLQQRIRSFSVLLMVVSMLTVGAVSVGYSFSRQKKVVEESISDKLRSAIISIEPKIQHLSSQRQLLAGALDSELFTTSNVIYADINIFRTTGELLGTSRHEAFTNELQGFWLSPAAYQAIIIQKRDIFLVNEHIGKLSYTSAYAPLLSRTGEILAVINLPYFTRENEIREQAMALVGRIANIYLLLAILAGISGYLAASSISKPLQRVRAAMRRTNITGKPEIISYNGNDEIGQLVHDYNRMVTELSKNAQLLAQGEKEKVWREMARQIAHEIKNPLTPIKLSLQQLVKLKKEGYAEWDTKFEEFSKMLLEQVGILTQTAGQFSNIARDTSSNASNVKLFELLSNTKALFAGQKGLTIETDCLDQNNVHVFADKELLQKAVTNLVKNAIQATINVKNPIITIAAECAEDVVLLSITDNGEGISPMQQARIFEPYFTTKSGGTGLGLVLTRKTIEEAGGSIWFTSEVGVGTTFFCKLPIFRTSKTN